VKSLRDYYDSCEEDAKMLTDSHIKTDAEQHANVFFWKVLKMRIINISLLMTKFDLINLQLF